MDADTSTNEEEVVSNTPNNAPASTPPSRTTETADNVRPRIVTNSQQQYAFPASIDPAFAGGASLPSPQPFFYATPYSSIVAAQNQTNNLLLTDIVKRLEQRTQNNDETTNSTSTNPGYLELN